MTESEPKKATILWVDLEMTGLYPPADKILEVAAIATDWDFNEIATYEGVVKCADDVLEARFAVSKDFGDKFPEVRRVLREQNASDAAKSASAIEGELIAFVKKHFAEGERVLLGGNSIHQDRRFIRAEWPELDKLLHYRMLDVSAWKVVFEGKYHKKFAKPEAHRALADIRGSIQELQYYLGKIKI